jgi:hypothetical protein
MNLFIRKTVLSPLANSEYWGNFERLLELPLDNEQFTAVIEFFQAASDYKNYILDQMTRVNGFSYIFFKSPQEPLVGYLIYGLVDKTNLELISRNNEFYDEYVEKRDILLNILGWSIVDERVIAIESDLIEETQVWTNLPQTFEDVSNLFQEASAVQSFLEK